MASVNILDNYWSFFLSFTMPSSVLEFKDKSLVFRSNLVTNQLLEVCCGSHFRLIIALSQMWMLALLLKISSWLARELWQEALRARSQFQPRILCMFAPVQKSLSCVYAYWDFTSFSLWSILLPRRLITCLVIGFFSNHSLSGSTLVWFEDRGAWNLLTTTEFQSNQSQERGYQSGSWD